MSNGGLTTGSGGRASVEREREQAQRRVEDQERSLVGAELPADPTQPPESPDGDGGGAPAIGPIVGELPVDPTVPEGEEPPEPTPSPGPPPEPTRPTGGLGDAISGPEPPDPAAPASGVTIDRSSFDPTAPEVRDIRREIERTRAEHEAEHGGGPLDITFAMPREQRVEGSTSTNVIRLGNAAMGSMGALDIRPDAGPADDSPQQRVGPQLVRDPTSLTVDVANRGPRPDTTIPLIGDITSFVSGAEGQDLGGFGLQIPETIGSRVFPQHIEGVEVEGEPVDIGGVETPEEIAGVDFSGESVDDVLPELAEVFAETTGEPSLDNPLTLPTFGPFAGSVLGGMELEQQLGVEDGPVTETASDIQSGAGLAANPFAIGGGILAGTEAAGFVAGGAPVIGEGNLSGRLGRVGEAAVATGTSAAAFVAENPLQGGAAVAAGLGTGLLFNVGASGALTRARSGFRGARLAGRPEIEGERLLAPEVREGAEFTEFSEEAMLTGRQAAEFRRRAREDPPEELQTVAGEPVVFSGRGGEFAGLRRVPAGRSEIEGMFTAPGGFSPFFLRQASGSSPSLTPGLPSIGNQPTIVAIRGTDVEQMPSGVSTVDVEVQRPLGLPSGRRRGEASQFLETQQGESTVFVRSPETVTGEAEAILPRGTLLQEEADLFVTEFEGQTVPVRTFRVVEETGGIGGGFGLGDLLPGQRGGVVSAESALTSSRRIDDVGGDVTPLPPTFGGGSAGAGRAGGAPSGSPFGSGSGFSEPFSGGVFGGFAGGMGEDPSRRVGDESSGGASSVFGSVSERGLFGESRGPGPTERGGQPPQQRRTPSQPRQPGQPRQPRQPRQPGQSLFQPPGSGGQPPFSPGLPGVPSSPMPRDRRRDSEDEEIGQRLPIGQEFVNPVASGFEFLFGREADVTDERQGVMGLFRG